MSTMVTDTSKILLMNYIFIYRIDRFCKLTLAYMQLYCVEVEFEVEVEVEAEIGVEVEIEAEA